MMSKANCHALKKYKDFFVKNLGILSACVLSTTKPTTDTENKCKKLTNGYKNTSHIDDNGLTEHDQTDPKSLNSDDRQETDNETLPKTPLADMECDSVFSVGIRPSQIDLTCEESLNRYKSADSSSLFLSVSMEDVSSMLERLACDARFFDKIAVPTPYEYVADISVVYVPEGYARCHKACNLPTLKVLGTGSYGKVFRVKTGSLKKVFETSELVIESYVTATVLAKADVKEIKNFKNLALKVPNSICFQHLSMRYLFYDTDLFHFKDHSFMGLRSYARMFKNLCDAILFLNIKCKIIHADVAATNILINTRGSIVIDTMLGDYSLATNHDLKKKIFLMDQNTNQSFALPRSGYVAAMMYQAMYRPVQLHMEAVSNPYTKVWTICTDAKHFCMLDLGALGNVALFFMIKLFTKHERRPVLEMYEKRIYTVCGLINKKKGIERSQLILSLIYLISFVHRKICYETNVSLWTLVHLKLAFPNRLFREHEESKAESEQRKRDITRVTNITESGLILDFIKKTFNYKKSQEQITFFEDLIV